MDSCPLEFTGAEAREMLAFAGLYKRGLPPVAGGALDQAAAFVDAARFVWAEESYWRTVLKIPGEF